MLPAKSRYYMMHGLNGTPIVVERLMKTATEADFDRRPDPDRFTIREVMGHMADWEGVWLELAKRMANEDNPHLQGYDEGQWAIDHNYGEMDVPQQVARFRTGRETLVAFLNSLKPEDWQRPCRHDEWGPSNIESMAVLVLGHDGYHTRQIADWLEAR
jgi:uncharacterized damage-inducible protein DinB